MRRGGLPGPGGRGPPPRPLAPGALRQQGAPEAPPRALPLPPGEAGREGALAVPGQGPDEGFARAGAFRRALARYRRTPEGILAIREGLEALEPGQPRAGPRRGLPVASVRASRGAAP
ncbi:hypothetical protein TT_P0224 (plasmid) [Thermus thermophilus HB27]|uniref:Uncharacterized protein n=1 Tax=Thermus thermophilus (strain ATCC BAA-163 / DSM 7039 / HB27) TaxID=262724 RepID=Q745T3_THET2|nr:hypothetical protein TT_P0224 [Thermus thermophilus HB27]